MPTRMPPCAGQVTPIFTDTLSLSKQQHWQQPTDTELFWGHCGPLKERFTYWEPRESIFFLPRGPPQGQRGAQMLQTPRGWPPPADKEFRPIRHTRSGLGPPHSHTITGSLAPSESTITRPSAVWSVHHWPDHLPCPIRTSPYQPIRKCNTSQSESLITNNQNWAVQTYQNRKN